MLTESIHATKIESARRRVIALCRYFGDFVADVEGAIYKQIAEWCSDFRGAYWKYYSLSNGGFLMAPECYSPLHLTNPANQRKEALDSHAAGIAICLKAYSELHAIHKDSLFSEAHERLRDYAVHHPEWPKIRRLLD